MILSKSYSYSMNVCPLLRVLRASSGSNFSTYSNTPTKVAHLAKGLQGMGNWTRLDRAEEIPRAFSTSSTANEKVNWSEGPNTFSKLLVANRGEIACRVLKTAKRLGIETVSIYSEVDSDMPHVHLADEAFCLGPAAASESYLNIDAIMNAIKTTGAQAVHPGYGFLSENSGFVRRLEEEGVIFVGPQAAAIAAMGDKVESKLLAHKSEVNVIPGYVGVVADEDEAVKIANDIGFPVMIKASAGGGGKGMRVAWDEAGVREGFRVSTSESAAAFGDDRLFLERFVQAPRHIEIQVLADSKGNTVFLPERECSIQRRNQKVVEESPSVFLDEATRWAMGEQACQLARAVGYQSAGTVEFLVDANKNFYFLEMNTRLQVEHPVTELVSGVDLVEQMLRVAAGEDISHLCQAELATPKGWSMEVRMYAEDPSRGYLPSTGVLTHYREPGHSESLTLLDCASLHQLDSVRSHFSPLDSFLKSSKSSIPDSDLAGVKVPEPIVRVDSGIAEGNTIGINYDPMISKLVTYGQDRPAALAAMRTALDEYVIRGVANNRLFLRTLMSHPDIVSGNFSTKFLEEKFPSGVGPSGGHLSGREEKEVQAMAVMFTLNREQRARAIADHVRFPTSQLGDKFAVSTDGNEFVNVIVTTTDSGFVVEFEATEDTDTHRVCLSPTQLAGPYTPLLHQPLLDGKPATVQVQKRLPNGFTLQYKGAQREVRVMTRTQADLAMWMPEESKEDQEKLVCSPMPGVLVSVAVAEGDEVEAGAELCVVEAMKMQNILRSPVSGKVKTVHASVGATLSADQQILELE